MYRFYFGNIKYSSINTFMPYSLDYNVILVVTISHFPHDYNWA